LPKLTIGVEGFTFDAAHYTKGASDKCLNIHGHTFRVDVEVEGEVAPETGMVIDFDVIKNTVKNVIKEFDHKLIVPIKDVNKIVLEGPFAKDIKVINYPEATTEYIALEIARKLYEILKMPVKVKVYEGKRNYVIAEWR